MSTNIIESLLNKMFCITLKYLDYTDLKACSLVCSKWNEAISASPDFLDRTCLLIRTESLSKDNVESMKLKRDYRYLKVTNEPSIPTNYPQIVFAPPIDCSTLAMALINILPNCSELKCLEVFVFHHRKVDSKVQNFLYRIVKKSSRTLEVLRLHIGKTEDMLTGSIKLPRLREVVPENCNWVENSGVGMD